MTYKTGLEDCYVIKNNKKMRPGIYYRFLCGSSCIRSSTDPAWGKDNHRSITYDTKGNSSSS